MHRFALMRVCIPGIPLRTPYLARLLPGSHTPLLSGARVLLNWTLSTRMALLDGAL